MIRSFNEGDVFYLLWGARWTLLLFAIAFAGGGILGLLIAFFRTSNSRIFRFASIAYIRVFQGTPLLIQLFLAFFVPGLFGYRLAPLAAASMGLSLNAASFLGEIWRGCIEAVPKGQWEAATSLGLRRPAMYRLIILPQALRVAVPPTVGYLVQLVKDTSLTSVIGYLELSRAGLNLANSTFRPFLVFSLVAIVYFFICFPLAKLSQRLERRLMLAHS